MFRIVGLCSEFFTFSLFHFIRACRRRSRNLFSGPPLGLIIIQNVCSLYIYYFVGYFVCANSRSQSQAPSKQGILIERLLFIYPPSKRLHSLVVNSFALAKKRFRERITRRKLRTSRLSFSAFIYSRNRVHSLDGSAVSLRRRVCCFAASSVAHSRRRPTV